MKAGVCDGAVGQGERAGAGGALRWPRGGTRTSGGAQRLPPPACDRSAAGAPGRARAISRMSRSTLSGPRSLCRPTRARSRRRERAPEPEVGRRGRRAAAPASTSSRHRGVAERPGPGVLVVALDRRLILGQDHAACARPAPARSRRGAASTSMTDHLPGASGRRSTRVVEASRCDPRSRAASSASDLERIAVAEQVEQRAHVCVARRRRRCRRDWRRSSSLPVTGSPSRRRRSRTDTAAATAWR